MFMEERGGEGREGLDYTYSYKRRGQGGVSISFDKVYDNIIIHLLDLF